MIGVCAKTSIVFRPNKYSTILDDGKPSRLRTITSARECDTAIELTKGKYDHHIIGDRDF
jgi:hypothetical protein